MNYWSDGTNQKLCAHCYNNITCETLRHAIKTGTRITTCRSLRHEDEDAALRIAENPDLMRLIYDYFLDQIDLKDFTKEEIENVIIRTLTDL